MDEAQGIETMRRMVDAALGDGERSRYELREIGGRVLRGGSLPAARLSELLATR